MAKYIFHTIIVIFILVIFKRKEVDGYHRHRHMPGHWGRMGLQQPLQLGSEEVDNNTVEWFENPKFVHHILQIAGIIPLVPETVNQTENPIPEPKEEKKLDEIKTIKEIEIPKLVKSKEIEGSEKNANETEIELSKNAEEGKELEEPQNEEVKEMEEAQNEELKEMEEPQNEEVKLIEEPQEEEVQEIGPQSVESKGKENVEEEEQLQNGEDEGENETKKVEKRSQL